MSFSFRTGTSPVLVSIPHNGADIPDEIASQMTEAGKRSPDTDWFLDQLYDLSEAQRVSWLVAKYSRYVIDLNRPPDDQNLYPGQATPGLVPTACFDGTPIYLDELPAASDIERRIETYWKPYHEAVNSELARLQRQSGVAVLIEAHSIASEVPRLFEGKLPDFNFGTNHGQACDPGLLATVESVLEQQSEYSFVSNDRFVGGYLTRCFGQPERGRHALQIELSQATYLDESTGEWDIGRAQQVQAVLRKLLTAILNWADQQAKPARSKS